LAFAASVLLGTGCIGPFNAWHQMLNWNEHVCENHWGQEGVFLVCNILPVYGLCSLGDVLIFNSIEFWGGKNPIPPVEASKKTSKLDATHDLSIEKVADGKVEVQVLENGAVIGTYTIDQTNGRNSVLRDTAGNALAAAEMQPNGEVTLVAVK
jgi:hypothetical protein